MMRDKGNFLELIDQLQNSIQKFKKAMTTCFAKSSHHHFAAQMPTDFALILHFASASRIFLPRMLE